MYDFENGQNSVVGIAFGCGLAESGLDFWKGNEFVCLPEGSNRLCVPHSLLLDSYWGSFPGGSGQSISGDIQNPTPQYAFREWTRISLFFRHCTFFFTEL